MANLADIAARIHEDMCNDGRNGYSWEPRWGGDHPDGDKTLYLYGRSYTYPLGSYDCSSSVITAWRLALEGTPYEGALDGATYTGNMRQVFLDSGLFWADRSPARRGDVYLNDEVHTAMCQDGGDDGVYGYDALSEFSINENGDVYGGEVGDQNDWESHIREFYERPWDTTLHYNGQADSDGSPTSTPVSDGRLDVDGWFGYQSVSELQRRLGTVVDGVISGQDPENRDFMEALASVTWECDGSLVVTALQERVGADVDGYWGRNTSMTVQEYLIRRGYDCGPAGIDGFFGNDSAAALQRALNDDNF